MKKTYWWRVAISLFAGVIIIGAFVYDKYYCFLHGSNFCLLDRYRLTVIEPIVFASIFLFVVSLSLFFVIDNVFKRWLKFAIIWFIVTAIFVYKTPVYSGDWIGLNPTKYLVSIWMGVLFVIISLVLIIWQVIKERKK